MDRSLNLRKHRRFLLVCLLSSVTGCATSPVQVPTLWDRLGIPAAGARLRDATLNRNGNFPGLEKKPPVLRIADPANLAEGKPEVVKTAAKIKQDQDMKKQKLKAIKFLAEVGCGCYNKDDQVAKALLEALNDCDPDVKKAAIAAISQNAAACKKCSNGCETTCCTADIVKKLEEMAVGIDEKGCPKEPDREIRSAAMSALKQCGCAPEKPPEEIPALDVEEVLTPDRIPVEGGSRDAIPVEGSSTSIKLPEPEGSAVTKVSFVGSDSMVETHQRPSVNPSTVEAKPPVASPASYGDGTEPVRLARRKSNSGEFISGISNADQLVQARVFAIASSRNGLEVEMPDAFDLAMNQQLILVDRGGNIQVATLTNVVGKRLSLKLDSESVLMSAKGDVIRVGLLSQ